MVSFMTSSSSSKMEYICIFYDVFDVGVFAGSSFIEVSHLYIIGIFILPLLKITSHCWISLVVLNPTSLSLLNSELICEGYGSSGFTGSIWLLWFFVTLPRAVVPLAIAVVPLGGSGSLRRASDTALPGVW